MKSDLTVCHFDEFQCVRAVLLLCYLHSSNVVNAVNPCELHCLWTYSSNSTA